MRTTPDEQASHIYQMGLEFITKLSICLNKAQVEHMEERFLYVAKTEHAVEDQLAADRLAQICRIYIDRWEA
jgi:hypothetical protein